MHNILVLLLQHVGVWLFIVTEKQKKNFKKQYFQKIKFAYQDGGKGGEADILEGI